MNNVNVKIKKLSPNAKIPTQGSQYSAGVDLYACLDKTMYILPHQTMKIPTGIAITPPDNTFGAIFARSGLSTKKGLRPANCVGVCDIDYTGEYVVPLHNDSEAVAVIKPNERVAQLVFLPCINQVNFIEVDNLKETQRGNGGFGSTGNV